MRTLLLTFDGLPRRWFGCYGGMEIGTRGFDTLAANGCVFNNCFVDTVERSSSFGLTLAENGEWLADSDGVEQPIWTNDFPLTAGEARLGRDLSVALKWMKSLEAGGAAWVRHPGILSESWPWQPDDADDDDIAGGLEDIDQIVLKFFAKWQDLAAPDWTLIVAGGCGLARRQPRIAKTGTGDRELETLCDDLIHVPVWLVNGKGAPFGTRVSPLHSLSTIGPTIVSATSGNQPRPAAPTLFDLIAGRQGASELVIRDRNDVAALRTPDWFYRRKVDSAGEIVAQSLFRKPDDVCDVFDVSQLHPEVAERLAVRLQPSVGVTRP